MIMFARDDDSPPPLTDEQRNLFDDHVPAVRDLARRRASSGHYVAYDDYLQHGLMGLLEAVRRFHGGDGARFWTYARRRVAGAMADAVRGGFGNTIKIGRKPWESMDGERRGGFQSLRFEAIEQWQFNAGACRSTEADVLGVEPEESPIDADALWKTVAGLGKRAALVVMMYHRMHMTMREIGENLGLSEGRVSQMHTEALEQLRTNPRVLTATGRRGTA